jgi:hypothetical protein
MSAEVSALVLVLPDDNADAIIAKVRETGSESVQLLVPEGTTALQSPDDCQKIHHLLEQERITLVVISSDEQALQVARRCQLETIAVEDTHVTIPETLSSPPVIPAPVAAPAAVAVPDTGYDDSLSELDNLGDLLSGQKSEEDYDPFGELDTLSDVMSGAKGEEAYDPFGELDDLSEVMSGRAPAAGDGAPSAAGAAGTVAPPPRRRIRPEDIELSDEEKEQASSVRAGGGRSRVAPDKKKGKEKEKSSPLAGLAGLVAGLGSKRKPAPAPDHEEAPATSRGVLPAPAPLFAVLMLLMLLFIVAAIFFMMGRATVVVALPSPESQEFDDQPILLTSPGEDSSPVAVEAETISAMTVVTATGQVQRETMAPSTTARGTINILNSSFQPITLPEGTEFIGTNPQGQEVRFVSDTAVTIPPASQVRQGRQIITTMGATSVDITARSAGSNSNIDANALTHFVIPGQQPIPVNTGALEIEQPAIGGGSEQPIRIVTDEDVQGVLSEALTQLINKAKQELETAASNQGLNLEQTTVWPGANDLSRGEGYEIIVSPPIGQPVPDPANPFFTVTVRGNFNALVTPPERPIEKQLQAAVPNQLRNEGLLPSEVPMSVNITGWRWDGSRLIVDGVMQPEAQKDLSAKTRTAIRNAVKGKSRSQAQQALEDFEQRGLISGYKLPDKDTMPSWDVQLDLKVVPASQ